MKHLLLSCLVLLLSFPAWAGSKSVIDIKVDGMVCDFCAQAIWKVFDDYEAVEKIDVNLDTGIVSVSLNPEQDLTDEQLEKAITYSGYKLVDITRRENTTE